MRASNVEYHAPARFDDLLECFVRASRLGRTSMSFEVAAVGLADDTLMVTGSQTLVLIEAVTRTPVPIPESVRETIRAFEARRCGRVTGCWPVPSNPVARPPGGPGGRCNMTPLPLSTLVGTRKGDAIPRSGAIRRAGRTRTRARTAGGRFPRMSANEPYAVLNIAEIEPIPAAGILWKPLRRPLGIDAFGINAYTAVAPGDHVIERHTEGDLRHQEVYIVIAGHATFTIDGVEIDAPNGSVVFLRDHSLQREAVAVEAGTTVLAVGGAPGTHSPSAWEWYFAAEQYRASGDYDAALALLADGLEHFPDNPAMIYSIACWEAMAGKTDAAIEALTKAIELNPRNADWAKNDADLDAIRGLPGSPI